MVRAALALTAVIALCGPALAGEGAPAAAKRTCHDYARIAAHLGTKYAERPVGHGLRSDGQLIQVFASETTGSWTLVTVAPNGRGCVLAVGKEWDKMNLPGRAA